MQSGWESADCFHRSRVHPCPSVVSILSFRIHRLSQRAASRKSVPILSTMSTTADAPQATQPADADIKAVQALKTSAEKIKAELSKVIVGQEAVVDEVLVAILTRSHALLVGVPGLAKTLLVSTLSQTLHLSFKRIQFTPDLMPSDITGTEVIYQDPSTNERQFRFLKGPIFANMILADEINRTPPK